MARPGNNLGNEDKRKNGKNSLKMLNNMSFERVFAIFPLIRIIVTFRKVVLPETTARY